MNCWKSYYVFVIFLSAFLPWQYRVQGYQLRRRWTQSWKRSQGLCDSRPRPVDVAWFPAAPPSRRGPLGGCSRKHCCQSAPPEEKHTQTDQNQTLCAKITIRERAHAYKYTQTHTHKCTEKKINICYDGKMKVPLWVTTEQGMRGCKTAPPATPPTCSRTHTHTHLSPVSEDQVTTVLHK